MERVTIAEAKQLFQDRFIGADELKLLFNHLHLDFDVETLLPKIQFSLKQLERFSDDYILICGVSFINQIPISIRTMRTVFGMNPDEAEPCFYNQDWYLGEDFIDETLENRWYLIKKDVFEKSRSIQPVELIKQHITFPSAILCTYTFFAYYYATGEKLWYHDFVWCSDTDHNGDRIYIGKYHDVDGVNKNGFSIHRHLSLRSCYASVDCL